MYGCWMIKQQLLMGPFLTHKNSWMKLQLEQGSGCGSISISLLSGLISVWSSWTRLYLRPTGGNMPIINL